MYWTWTDCTTIMSHRREILVKRGRKSGSIMEMHFKLEIIESKAIEGVGAHLRDDRCSAPWAGCSRWRDGHRIASASASGSQSKKSWRNLGGDFDLRTQRTFDHTPESTAVTLHTISLSPQISPDPQATMAEQLIQRGTLEGHSGWVTSLATSLEKSVWPKKVGATSLTAF